jgi:hypothetical protein
MTRRNQPGFIHHREENGHAPVDFTYQLANEFPLLSEGYMASRRSLYPQLFFHPYNLYIVRFPK